MTTRSSASECTGWYRGTDTPPWTSRWSGSRKGATKHAASMLEVDRGGKRELGEDIGEHLVGGAPDDASGGLFDQVANVVVVTVNSLTHCRSTINRRVRNERTC